MLAIKDKEEVVTVGHHHKIWAVEDTLLSKTGTPQCREECQDQMRNNKDHHHKDSNPVQVDLLKVCQAVQVVLHVQEVQVVHLQEECQEVLVQVGRLHKDNRVQEDHHQVVKEGLPIKTLATCSEIHCRNECNFSFSTRLNLS